MSRELESSSAACDKKIEACWYLDTGATHHMIGRRELFSDLNTDVQGTLKFSDASGVEIKGVGSVIFTTKTSTV